MRGVIRCATVALPLVAALLCVSRPVHAQPDPPPGIAAAVAPAADADPRPLDELLASRARGLPPAPDPPAAPDLADDDAARLADLVRQATAAAAALDHYRAALVAKQALELDPTNADALRIAARSAAALRNRTRAADAYAALLQVRPGDDEAALAVALDAANMRRFEDAVDVIARARDRGASFDHAPGARIITDFVLANALRRIGAEQAAIDAARRLLDDLDAAPVGDDSPYAARIASVFRQRGDLWREIGDAELRLDRPADAIDAYRRALDLPLADPAALAPRLVFAHLQRDDPDNAARTYLDAVDASTPPLDETLVDLASYLHDQLDDARADALRESLEQRFADGADDAGLLRATVSIAPPDRAAGMMADFLERRPRDLAVAGELLAQLAARDRSAAASLAVRLVEAQPDLSDRYASRLARAAPDPRRTLDAVAGRPPSTARALLEADLLGYLEQLGAAWETISTAAERDPGSAAVHRLRLDLAAALDEPMFVRDAAEAIPDDLRDELRPRVIRAERTVGALPDALRRADARLEAAPDDVAVRLERALILGERAARAESMTDRTEFASLAIAEADRAVSAAEINGDDEPHADALLVMLELAAPESPAADRAAFGRARRALRQLDPDHPALERLDAAESFGRRRYEEALERLLRLYDQDPADASSLALAISAWAALDQLEAARRWLEEQRASNPDDPLLLEQWVRLMLEMSDPDAALEALDERLAARPDHGAALRLQEAVLRGLGENDRAAAVGLRRLADRPPGARRSLQTAALHAAAGDFDAAIDALRWLLDHPDRVTAGSRAAGVRLLDQLPPATTGRDRLALALADAIVERGEARDLAPYAAGLVAAARLADHGGADDDAFDRWVRRFIASTADEEDPRAAPMAWLRAAQRLADDQLHAAAARLLRAALSTPGAPAVDDGVFRILASGVVALSAVDEMNDPDRAGAGARGIIDQIAAAGQLNRLTDQPGLEVTRAAALFDFSRIYSLLGAEAGAAALLEDAVAANPDDSMAMNNLAYARLDEGRVTPDVVAMIERAYELAPDDPNILDTVGWLRYGQQDFDAALRLIEQAVEAGDEPPSPEVLDHLGDTLWRLGRSEDAAEQWRRAERIAVSEYPRRELIRNFTNYQLGEFGLVVADPEVLYDRLYGGLVDRIQGKLSELRLGLPPSAAPTLAERSASPDEDD